MSQLGGQSKKLAEIPAQIHDSAESALLFRRRCVEGEPEVAENGPGALVDVHLAHPGAFHHGVEGREVLFDEADEFGGIEFDGGHRFAEALEALDVRHQAEGHHGERFGFEIAEKEPVGPLSVEVLVKFPDFRDGVEFLGIVIPAIDEKLEGSHHGGEFRSLGEGRRAVLLEEVGELPLAHLHLAEDDHDGVLLLAHGLMGMKRLRQWEEKGIRWNPAQRGRGEKIIRKGVKQNKS